MPEEPTRRQFYWERHVDGKGGWVPNYQWGPPGVELAALRRGLNQEPGTVASMSTFYIRLNEDGILTDQLRAEHLALTLFAVHQQSKLRPVHRKGIPFGSALKTLRESENFHPEALDRRFGALATAISWAELSAHMRGLVSQLRTLDSGAQGLDYTDLFWNLVDWQKPEELGKVRRSWGSRYFAFKPTDGKDNPAANPEK